MNDNVVISQIMVIVLEMKQTKLIISKKMCYRSCVATVKIGRETVSYNWEILDVSFKNT